MTEHDTNQSDIRDSNETELVWLQARPSDFDDLDFENPIADFDDVNYFNMRGAFRDAAELHEKLNDEAAEPAMRVFFMLTAVVDFLFKPSDRNEPFGPIFEMDGRRSPIPDDFRGEPVKALALAAERSTNPVLKSRLCDVCWLLERNRHELGRSAITAYVDVVEGLKSGKLNDRFNSDKPELGVTTRDFIERALAIARVFDRNAPEVQRAMKCLLGLKAEALAGDKPVPVIWFAKMDFNFRISEAIEIAKEIEGFLGRCSTGAAVNVFVDLWRLASSAYAAAKDEDGKKRCQIAAAETFAKEAEQHTSAIVASHWLSNAIAEYHGVQGSRERRNELRLRLIDVQADIRDEMTSFSEGIDLTDIVKALQDNLNKQSTLSDKLLLFATLTRSPERQKLTEDAIEAIRKYPLSSLFGTSIHDHEGKVVHKSSGGGFADGDNKDALRSQIAQHENIRREIETQSVILITRQHIMEHHNFSEDTLNIILSHSPFVPRNVLSTYVRGFFRFFQGDYTSALYILTPMLENSLRYVLKATGKDVTNFDDATQTQQDRTISVLFDQMREPLNEVFGEALIDDLDRVFLSKPGPSIRHEVAHGLLHDGSPNSSDAIYAMWLMFHLCCLPLLKHWQKIELPS